MDTNRLRQEVADLQASSQRKANFGTNLKLAGGLKKPPDPLNIHCHLETFDLPINVKTYAS